MKTCRVIITTECNLSCSYCCNKLPEVQAKFKMTTIDQLIEMDYDVFNISGGEPLLEPKKLLRLARSLKCRGKKVYLYSNGTQPFSLGGRCISDFVDGVNIGIHDMQICDLKLNDIISLSNNLKAAVRMHLNEDSPLVNEYKIICNMYRMGLKLWKMNECDNDNEDWYIC